MSIPEHCTVLVVGGGPGGSYTASVLAREGIDTVLLEADKFPRYHIGESMLPSIRHYLRFIDLDETFNKHGFTKKVSLEYWEKRVANPLLRLHTCHSPRIVHRLNPNQVGAAFKMIPHQREGFTDFIAGDKDHYSWNVIRSEADELIFRHAGKSGAKTFDGVKVNSVEFASTNGGLNGLTNGTNDGTPNNTNSDHHDSKYSSPGRPISASYTRKADGTTGTIRFDYIVDASGRVGVLNTKYLKNRHYNTALKNVANWAYYEGTNFYNNDATRRNTPFFEALNDESGWAWFIPLHNGTTSIGIVMNQAVATKKKAAGGSNFDFFTDSLELVPSLLELIGTGKRVTEVKAASDFSYHSSSYAFPHARVVGDAGCFIDPFFFSGVHLAMTGGLSAGTTIAASIRGDVDEHTAAQWHTSKVREGYARFLLVVLSAYQQMMHQEQPVLSDHNEDNFDRAFSFFKPVIQGTVDSSSKLSQAELSKTLDFICKAFDPQYTTNDNPNAAEALKEPAKEGQLSAEDLDALKAIRTHHSSTVLNGLNSFTTDVVEGRLPRLERGRLTLVQA